MGCFYHWNCTDSNRNEIMRNCTSTNYTRKPECNRKCREWSQSSSTPENWSIMADVCILLNQHQIMKSTVSALLRICKQHTHTAFLRIAVCRRILLIWILHSFAYETNKQFKSVEWIEHAMIHISNRHNLKCMAKVLFTFEKSAIWRHLVHFFRFQCPKCIRWKCFMILLSLAIFCIFCLFAWLSSRRCAYNLMLVSEIPKALKIIFRWSVWILIRCDTHPSVREFKCTSCENSLAVITREQTATEMNSLWCQWEYDLVFAMQFILCIACSHCCVCECIRIHYCATRLIPRKFNCRGNFRAPIHALHVRSFARNIHSFKSPCNLYV